MVYSCAYFENGDEDLATAQIKKIDRLLPDDGMALNHGITSTDINNGESPYGAGEFIDRYVFPAGELPPTSAPCCIRCRRAG